MGMQAVASPYLSYSPYPGDCPDLSLPALQDLSCGLFLQLSCPYLVEVLTYSLTEIASQVFSLPPVCLLLQVLPERSVEVHTPNHLAPGFHASPEARSGLRDGVQTPPSGWQCMPCPHFHLQPHLPLPLPAHSPNAACWAVSHVSWPLLEMLAELRNPPVVLQKPF